MNMNDNIEDLDEDKKNKRIDYNVAMNIGYSVTAVIIGIYFIIQGIRKNYFDYICFPFMCMPYAISYLLVGIKGKNTKKIIIGSICVVILMTSFIMRLIGIGIK